MQLFMSMEVTSTSSFLPSTLLDAELGTLFPSIPLVAEEDSTFLRSNNLAHSVLKVVTHKSSSQNELTQDDVLEAIDRGANAAFAFGSKPATYWVGIPNCVLCLVTWKIFVLGFIFFNLSLSVIISIKIYILSSLNKILHC